MSEDIIERHLRDGDLTRTKAGYFCNVCSSPLGQQPLPHLQGTNHNNAIFLLTLNQPSRYRERYMNIPECIRTALEKGEIVAKEKKVMCRICDDVPLSKEKSVRDHLLGSLHANRVASMSPLVTPPQSLISRDSAQAPFSSRDSAQPPFSSRDLAQPPFSSRYLAQPLFSSSDLAQPPFSSRNLAQPPFSSRDLAQPPYSFRDLAQPPFSSRDIAQPPFSSREAGQSVFSRQGEAQSPSYSSSIVPDESSFGHEAPSTTAERSDSTVARALRDGHIKMIQRDGIDGFMCNVCSNTNMITGDTPMLQHLLGKTHLKNVKKHEFRQQQPSGAVALPQPSSPPSRSVDQLPDQRRSSVDQHQYTYHHQQPSYTQEDEFNNQGSSSHQQNPNYSQQNEFNYQQNSPHQQNLKQSQTSNQQLHNIMTAFPNLTLNVNVGVPSPPTSSHQATAPPPASSNPFRTNYPRQTSRRQAASAYEIESSPRGIVVVFNYYFEGKGLNQRDGAAADYQNLHKVFTKMGYEVWPENKDFTKQQTLDKLDEIRSSGKLTLVDSLITFFLSHGGDSPDSFRTVDEEVITVEEIIYTKFTDAECPQLRRKPKLFFFNFCRGKTEQIQRDFWKPNSSFADAPKDVAVIQAALPHFAAKRHIENGTLFVDCLCEVLTEDAETLDLNDIVRNTSGLMQRRGGTTATPWYIDFGKFFFL